MRTIVGVVTLLVAGAALMTRTPLRAQAMPAAPSPELRTLLAAAALYLNRYEQQFAAVVAEEQYTQEAQESGITPVGVRTKFAQSSQRSQRRSLRSDVMVLNLGASDWIQFRDVYEVDSKPVRDHDARLQALLEKPSTSALDEAQRIADESAHYNLGVARNINVPTMALTYLARRNQPRSQFEVAGVETVHGIPTRVVKFHETATPSLITTPDGPVATSGRFWIDPTSGDVIRTELVCVVSHPWALTGTTTVDYVLTPTLGLLVPTQMNEEYRRSGEVDRGHATYSKFRAFSVDTTTMRRGGGSLRGPSWSSR
jgi:hypothetical protein